MMEGEINKLNLIDIFQKNTLYREDIIEKYYCHKYPKKSRRVIAERCEQDILVAVFDQLLSDKWEINTDEELNNKLDEIRKKIKTNKDRTFKNLFPDEQILDEINTNFSHFLLKVGRKGILLPFYVPEEKYDNLNVLYDSLVEKHLIHPMRFTYFRSNFTYTDPMKDSLLDGFNRFKKRTPILWTGIKNVLAYFLDQLHPILIGGLGKYEAADSLIEIYHDSSYELGKLDGSNNQCLEINRQVVDSVFKSW